MGINISRDMNKNEQLIWERYEQAYHNDDDKIVMFEALQEAHNMLEEAKVTQAMVDQINTQLGLSTPLTLDQLTQIQSITNPGVGAAIGGALGKVGGWLTGKAQQAGAAGKAMAQQAGAAVKNQAQQAGAAIKNQVTNPESGLRQGLATTGQAIKAGAQNVAQGVQAGAQAAADEFGPARAAAAPVPGEPEEEDPTRRDPQTGRFVRGNQSGVQYAENIQAQIDSLKPGWGNKVIR